MRSALTCLLALYALVRCCFSMQYFETFAPLVLVCELSMMLAAAVCVLLWICALGEPGKRLRGMVMVPILALGSWTLWRSEAPELVSAHVRFALDRKHYIEAARAWAAGAPPSDATVERGTLVLSLE